MMKMKVHIAYALPSRQVVQSVDVPEGTSIRSAIEVSGVLEQLPHVDLTRNKVGIFGKVKPLDTVLADGDRVEIYQPITVDPKKIPKRKTAGATKEAGSAQ
jgi:uncharacterized protein